MRTRVTQAASGGELPTNSRLVSLNIGLPRPLAYRGKHIPSGIVKAPVSGPLWLGKTGLKGDGQADLQNHGGPDKAVCGYPSEHYPYWSSRLDRELPSGSFGENFSVEGLLESEVCIGDTYQIGTSVVQVSQPRQPCSKLAARHGVKELALWVQEAGQTGFYFRCLEPGRVRAGDTIVLIERPAQSICIAEANRVMHRDKYDIAGIERLLALPELSASWRRTLEKRYSDGRENTRPD